MFDQHHEASPAETDDRAIWRFVNFAQFVDLLDAKSLHFARVDTLEDPYGGLSDETAFATRTLPEELMRLAEQTVAAPPRAGRLERWWSRKTRETQQDSLINAIRNYRPTPAAWANCWHVVGPDDVAMWKMYAGAGKSIAIRTSPTKLRTSIAAEPEFSLTVRPVCYVDAATLKDLTDPIDRALAKSRALSSEREVRAILTRTACGEDCLGRGVSVPVDVSGLIEDLAVSPAAGSWLGDLARRVMRTYGFDEPAADRLALPDYTSERALLSA